MARSHCVSKFHLAEFCDPASMGTHDPWLWVGTIGDGRVRRRSPKNVGTVSDLFDGPGGFAEPEASIEVFLANEVEGPASRMLRQISAGGQALGQLPPAIMRYLAWAASRSLPMQRLEAEWAARFGPLLVDEAAEGPPASLTETMPRARPLRLMHPVLGRTTVASGDAAGAFLDAGWFPDPSERSNFLEAAHIQAFYFQARWFPRLRWFTLRPPDGQHFIIGDRPVGWGVPDCLDAPPCCLRESAAFLIAPLSRNLALVGRNDDQAWAIATTQVNAILAAWSHDWIAGPSASIVADALHDREEIIKARGPHPICLSQDTRDSTQD